MPIKVEVIVGFLPVVTFLATLLYLDTYKLLKLRSVVAVVIYGALAAGAAYFINDAALSALHMQLTPFTRYVSPLIEESLKGLIIVVLIRTHRIGFLVDAAIFGFAAGTGFAMLENIHFLGTAAGADVGSWIVRGFGTAGMHAGATALFAVITLTMMERAKWRTLPALLPGFGVALVLHSGFNHLSEYPRVATFAMFVIVPLLFYLVFVRGEKATSEWLGAGFDADAEMLALINSGNLAGSALGTYLKAMEENFGLPVVTAVLAYLRLHIALAMRAKGMLMMRQNGFDLPVDDEVRKKFAAMRDLEQSIGKMGLLAVQPMLRVSRKDLWQMYMLGK